jgi:hypothetical protein
MTKPLALIVSCVAGVCLLTSLDGMAAAIVCPANASPVSTAIAEEIDWPAFMARHDLLWSGRLPATYGERPFTGNGLVGVMLYQKETELRLHLGRVDVQDHRKNETDGWSAYSRPRFLIGEFGLQPAGAISGGTIRQDLWNAEVRGEIVTDKGTIAFTQFVPTEEMAVVVILKPDKGETGCAWRWHPGEAKTTREGFPTNTAGIKAFAQMYGDYYEKTLKPYVPNPPVRLAVEGDIQVSIQDLLVGGGYAVAWKETALADGRRVLYIGTGDSRQPGEAAKQARAAVQRLATRSLEDVIAAHRAWWHDYYPLSFVSLPEARWESFYWIQMYKLACATRQGRTMMDTAGPWNMTTPWPYITHDLNVQLCYWPVVTANRLELGKSLIDNLSRKQQVLVENVRPVEWQSDSAYLSVTSAQDLIEPRDGDKRYYDCVGNLTWELHNCWQMYRVSMDDSMLRRDIFPLLRRSINFYLHLLTQGPDGKLHLPVTYSPEFGKAPDGNFDLALLRWGCRTLLWSCERLKIADPLQPKWQDVLARLADYPVDPAEGYMIGAGVRLSRSHRHYSHLLMIYPLHLVNIEQPGAASLMDKSIRHWIGKPGRLMGYSFTGASSLMAMLGRGDDALQYLRGLDEYLKPNTMYVEAGPCMETPLSAAQSIHDMILQSWGDKIRVFPAMPASWPDLVFHNLRAEGAFLVSARRTAGKTQWVRVKSLAGEPCRIKPELPGDVKIQGCQMNALGNGVFELKLLKGGEALLYSSDTPPSPVAAPLSADPATSYHFGIQKKP